MNLYDYQILAKQLISECFQRLLNAVILCMDTGSGKTVCFADMTKDCLNNGWPVLIMCNRKELIGQAKKKLNSFGLYPVLIIPEYKDQYSNLYLASVDTLNNRKLPDVKIVFIDECHLRDFDEIALIYKARGVKIVGVTATPERSGRASLKDFPEYTGQLSDIYEDIVFPITSKELLERGFKVPLFYYGPEVDTSDLKIEKTKDGIDYSKKDLFNKFNKPKLYAGVVDNYLKLANGRKAIVFNIKVEHSKKQNEEFLKRGIKSAHLDAKCKNREKILEDFTKGNIMVLNNVGIATFGFDEPTIEAVIINRITMSNPLYRQMVGRGSRLAPWIGKEDCIVIDHGGNVWKHGFAIDHRDYNLDSKRISQTIGPAPIKECPECGRLMPVSQMLCECGLIQEKKESNQPAPTAEFTLLDSNNIPKELKKELYKMSISELEKYRELKEYKLGWLVRQLYKRGDDAIIEYARFKGYQDAWIHIQIKNAEAERIKSKEEIWNYIIDNPHLDDEAIKLHSLKKLKSTHKENDINILIPKIIKNAQKYRLNPEFFN